MSNINTMRATHFAGSSRTQRHLESPLAGPASSARSWPITGAPFDEPFSMDEQDVALHLAVRDDIHESPNVKGQPLAAPSARKWKCDLGNGQWDHDWQKKSDSAGGEGGSPLIEWS